MPMCFIHLAIRVFVFLFRDEMSQIQFNSTQFNTFVFSFYAPLVGNTENIEDFSILKQISHRGVWVMGESTG